jgi:hypothetical protein
MLKVLMTARYFAVDPEPLDLLRAQAAMASRASSNSWALRLVAFPTSAFHLTH